MIQFNPKMINALVVSFHNFDAAMLKASKPLTKFGFLVGATFNPMSRYRWPGKGRSA